MGAAQSPRAFQKWLDRAIFLCLPMIIVNVPVGAGWAFNNGTGTIANICVVAFPLILTAVAIILLIHFVEVATSFLTRAIRGSAYRAIDFLGGIGSGLLCVLLVVLVAVDLSRLGDFIGGDAFLMQIEIFAVGGAVWWKVHKRRLQREQQQKRSGF